MEFTQRARRVHREEGDGLSDLGWVEVLPRSLHCATRRAKSRLGRKSRVAPVGMTAFGKGERKMKRGLNAEFAEETRRALRRGRWSR